MALDGSLSTRMTQIGADYAEPFDCDCRLCFTAFSIFRVIRGNLRHPRSMRQFDSHDV